MRITIGNKILGGFLVVLILLAIGSGISINRISFTDQSYKQLIGDNVKSAMMAKDLQALYLNQANAVKSYLLTGSNDYLVQYKKDLQKANDTINLMLKAYKSKDDLEIIKQLGAFQKRYDEIVMKEVALKKEGDEVGYSNVMNTSGKTISNVFQKKIEVLDKRQEKLTFTGMQETSNTVDNTKTIVLYIGIVSVLIGIAIAIFLSRSISRPIKLAADAMHKIADGNLQIDSLKVKNKDEVGELINSYNKMVQDLRVVVGEVQEVSSSVASSSEELAASSQESTSASEQVSRMTQDSAEGTEQQLLQYKELSISVREMNDGIQQIAENSEEMLLLTEKTSTLTQKGEQFIDHVVGQMNQIQQTVSKASSSIHSLRERSNEISQIIEIITGVAEQTNLLALNAAIEAARAGEHGKGFAVVAEEVRKLAEESKRSAGQITKMIHHIQIETNHSVQMMDDENLQVEEGLKETEEANHAFKLISHAMGEVTKKVVEVSASVQQMIAVSNQIIEAINVAQKITEKSAFNSQESAAATQEQFAAMEEVAVIGAISFQNGRRSSNQYFEV